MEKRKIIRLLTGVIVLVVFAVLVVYVVFFGAPQESAASELFIVPIGADRAQVIEKLSEGGFIKSSWAFGIALQLHGVSTLQAGGYKISKAMSVWETAGIIGQSPYMKWVTIPEGLRKEEIAELLQKKLGWSDAETQKWVTTYTAEKSDYFEGVYFPDTYLIPVDESPLDVAHRLQAKFEEKFAPYTKDAASQNIKWTTLLKIASIVQREAAGKNDMPLIAGILWNRLLKNMKLEVDATVQYARGDKGKGWWAPLSSVDKQIDSPYNSYKYAGLPPHPIANPGLDAIRAVLHPETTKCLFYLHDNSKMIHCAETYEAHQRNIRTYLK